MSTGVSFEQRCGRLKVAVGASPLTGVMGDVGSCVEKPVDAVAAVALYHGEPVGLSMLLDDVSQFSVTNAGLHCQKDANGESKGGKIS